MGFLFRVNKKTVFLIERQEKRLVVQIDTSRTLINGCPCHALAENVHGYRFYNDHCELRDPANQDDLFPIHGNDRAGMGHRPARHCRAPNRNTGHQRDRRIRNHPRRNHQEPLPAPVLQPQLPVPVQPPLVRTPAAHLVQPYNLTPTPIPLPLLTAYKHANILFSLFNPFPGNSIPIES
jgi:hypothetical protein